MPYFAIRLRNSDLFFPPREPPRLFLTREAAQDYRILLNFPPTFEIIPVELVESVEILHVTK